MPSENEIGATASSEGLPIFCCGKGQFDTRKEVLSDGRPNPDVGKPYGTMTFEQFRQMMLNPPVVSKGAGGWILASSYAETDARTFGTQEEKGSYQALLVDIDKNDQSLERVLEVIQGLLPDTRALVHSSVNSMALSRRWHILFPLSMPLPFKAFTAYQLALFRAFEHYDLKVDSTMARAAQLFFLPAKQKTDAFYQFADVPGQLYTPGGPLWLCEHACRIFELQLMEQQQARTSRGHGPHSIIGWFNSMYLTEDLMERYGYLFNGKEWASPIQQASGGRHSTMVRPDGSWFSLSHSDQAAGVGKRTQHGQNGDAFDLMKFYAFANNESAALAWAEAERRRQDSADPVMQQLKQMVEGMIQ